MPITKDPHQFNKQSLFVNREGVLGRRLYPKIEGFNFSRSIDLKPAREMVVIHQPDWVLDHCRPKRSRASSRRRPLVAGATRRRGHGIRQPLLRLNARLLPQ